MLQELPPIQKYQIIIFIIFSFAYFIRAIPTTHKTSGSSKNESESNETQESFSSSSGDSDDGDSGVSGDESEDGIISSRESEGYEGIEHKVPVAHEIGSAISLALEKADKYSKDLESVIRKADTQVSRWTKHIESIKNHLPGIGYGTSIITAYYTFWPLLRTFGKGLKKLMSMSCTVAGWFVRSKKNTKGKSISRTTPRRFGSRTYRARKSRRLS